MTSPSIDDAELRALIRSVLREVVPRASAAPQPPASAGRSKVPPSVTAPPQVNQAPLLSGRAALPPAQPGRTDLPQVAVGDDVDLRSDSDLDAFVRRLAGLLDNPKHRADILSGRRRFRLTRSPGPTSDLEHRVEKGAVTERHVRQAAEAGARLLLGRRAVMTPLARDRARVLGVVVDKEH
jgi:hypothetical protein